MYNYYYDNNKEKRQGWRSAAEIEIAALEHEKRWNRMMGENSEMPDPREQNKGGLKSLIMAPLRLLQSLIG